MLCSGVISDSNFLWIVTLLCKDLIRGVDRDEPTNEEDHYLQIANPRKERLVVSGAHRVVVTSEHGNVIVGVDAEDRPGLLLDISKGLLGLKLTLRHSEAAVVAERSISIWRCDMIGEDLPDHEEIWSVINTLLESIGGNSGESLKRKGTPVIRAKITPNSTLCGKTNNYVDFLNRYKAAVIAIQKAGRNVPLSGVMFAAGDVLILQAQNDSPLLKQPPADFYNRSSGGGGSVTSFVKRFSKSISGENWESDQFREEPSESNKPKLIGKNSLDNGDEEAQKSIQFKKETEIPEDSLSDEEAWKDLQVLSPDQQANGRKASREFLAAMEVAPKSNFFGRTVAEAGLDRLPGVFLVSIDRPDATQPNAAAEADATSIRTIDPVFTTITPETPLQDGDVLWFAGGAQSVGDL
jgi:uncharacterized protein with PhoU and TrkA domain